MEVVDVVTVSAREFNQDVAAAKRAAQSEPVVITDRGEPAFVLLSIDEYRRITGGFQSIWDALRPKEPFDFDVEFEVDRSIWPERVVFDDEDGES